MLRVIEDLAGDWRRLDVRIEGLSSEIETLARQDQHCERLMTVPGIGPIISSAMVAAIGTGDVFSKGRDFGAWLGLAPKQISTGDRTILGSRRMAVATVAASARCCRTAIDIFCIVLEAASIGRYIPCAGLASSSSPRAFAA
jgi:transposase